MYVLGSGTEHVAHPQQQNKSCNNVVHEVFLGWYISQFQFLACGMRVSIESLLSVIRRLQMMCTVLCYNQGW